MNTAPTPHHVRARDITELLTWCRRLTAAGPGADPTERIAYLATKAELLAAITDHPGPHPSHHHDGEDEQR
jgi:hypothetical protein